MSDLITSADVSRIFLDFFNERQHSIIPGHSLVPDNDPSLLFINSGMAPLKPYFLGQDKPVTPNLCNIQRCIRTGDIAEVGDRHHLTFFEMMGSWSIGQYWKKQAIELAWELLTEKFGFKAESLYATVYAGDDALGIPADEESYNVWRTILPESHIIRLGKDNLWGPAGEFGPCGPCTEVFFDTGDAHGEAYVPGGHFDDVNRYIEIWNAGVFMEYNMLPTGISKLDIQSVDTGSGLERMVMALNGQESCYDTDLMRPLMEHTLGELAIDDYNDPSARLISDHMRAAVMILADGVTLGASGAGYIPRRLIRRAIATAAQHDKPDFDFTGLLKIALDNAGFWNPHVKERRDDVLGAIEAERRSFDDTLASGLSRLEALTAQHDGELSGDGVFTLFSTYGMPVDIIRDYAIKHGKSIDEDGFEAAFKEHQDKSRAGDGGGKAATVGKWPMLDDVPATEFVGYDRHEQTSDIIALVKDDASVQQASTGDEVSLVVGSTPFYAEGGGQIGDAGIVRIGEAELVVRNTVKTPRGVFVHLAEVTSGQMAVGDKAELAIDAPRRLLVQANHSATHLLHAALRNLLGEDVGQAGSSVDAERLRFDFTYGAKLDDAQIYALEDAVNAEIRNNLARADDDMPYDKALESGALAFFGDSYDADVRVIGFDAYSRELCGGTHVKATGDIGLFVITSEGSVARGVRRIQAVTGQAAIDVVRARELRLKALADTVKVPLAQLDDRVKQLVEKASTKKKEAPAVAIGGLAKQAVEVRGGINAVIAEIDVDPKAMRDVALNLSAELHGVACMIHCYDGHMKLAIAVHKSATVQHHAGTMLKVMMSKMNGRGGGRDTYAEGVGTGDALSVDAVKAECLALMTA